MSLNGIDISYSQYDIDAGAVPADFVIIKATQGTWLTISCCDSQYQAAKASGKLVGVYHYAEGGNVQAEADYLGNTLIINCLNRMIFLQSTTHYTKFIPTYNYSDLNLT